MSFWEAMNRLALDTDQIVPPDLGNNRLGLDIAKQVRLAKDRGAPPIFSATLPPPFVNHMGFVNMHKSSISHDRENGKKNKAGTFQVSLKQTMRPHIVHGPAPAILSLKSTTLREVAEKVNHIHEDRIMFVKTIYAAHLIVGTNLLVEDTNKDCLLFSIYNFVPASEDPNDFFPEGTYMALLAPYMKNSGDDPTNNLLLRCDNPECIRLFGSRRSWLAAKQGKKLIDTEGLDPGQLRLDGNDAFVAGRYEAASRLYTRALQCPNIPNDDELACHSNLAETKIRQEQWEAAEEYAHSALELNPTHKKALFRLATAQIRLNKIGEAMKMIAKEGNEKEFKILREHTEQLLLEQDGLYDFSKLRREAESRPGQALSQFHANYTSPKIQQRVQISKRDDFTYRGTLAMEKLEGRTLVSSSKALVFSPGRESSLDYSIDPYSQSMLKGATMELESELISLMHRRPSTRDLVYSLASCASDSEFFEKEESKIDIKRVQQIVTSNTFGVTTEDETESAWQRHRDFQQGKSYTEMEANERVKSAQSGCGLWVNESLFNHSCTPNCTWEQIGDQMFVWTTRDVQDGEELSVPYVPHDRSFSERETIFRNWIQPGIGFSCQCEWCHQMRKSDELRKVEALVHTAYRKAAEMVTTDGVKMAVAAERVMPAKERKACFKILLELPLHMKHNAAGKLFVMEGSCLAHFDGDAQGALAAYEKAAEIKYAVRGGHSLDRAKDLWRIVGASMACDDPTKAQAVLSSIYQEVFASSHMKSPKEAFHGLTLNFALPWWRDSYDRERQHALEVLIDRAMKGSSNAPKAKSRNKKSNKRK